MVECLDGKGKCMSVVLIFCKVTEGYRVYICVFRAVVNKLFFSYRIFSLNVVYLAKIKP